MIADQSVSRTRVRQLFGTLIAAAVSPPAEDAMLQGLMPTTAARGSVDAADPQTDPRTANNEPVRHPTPVVLPGNAR
jgi:hypothetical protein